MSESDRPLDDDGFLLARESADEARPDDRIDDERMDEENTLKKEYVEAVEQALEDGDTKVVYELVEPLHPADIADLLELFEREQRYQLAAAITDLMTSEVVAELNDYVREDMMEALPPEAVAQIVDQLETDDAVQLIEDLDEANQRAILAEVEMEDRIAIQSALSYPEETAGRLMSRDFVAVPEHLTVGDLIDFLRDGRDLPDDFYEIFVVDEKHHPVGTCALSWVLRAPRTIPLADVMKRDQTLIPVLLDQEEVGLMFQKYNLISAAVIDENDRLVGQMTVDDVVHIISEEAGEDALLMSGAGEGDINEPIRLTVRSRLVWLVVNLGTAIIASSVVGAFQGVIAAFALLAVLMPIVSGMGGNAGTQTLAVVVRALATNQLTQSNTLRMVGREFRIALANGTALGILIGIGTLIIFRNPDLSIVIALAMVINNMVAGLSGVVVPVVLHRLDIDPAVSSSVFVTTMTDTMGFFSFLGLAALWGLGS